MTEKRIVIKIHFRVQRDNITASGDDERIDFNKTSVGVDDGPIQRHDEFNSCTYLLAFKTKSERNLSCMERHDTGRWVNADHQDFFRCFRCHFFNFHSAFSRRHEGYAILCAINNRSQVKFPCNIAAFFNIDALDFLAFRSGLMRYKLHPDHGFCGRQYFFSGFDDLYASTVTPYCASRLFA